MITATLPNRDAATVATNLRRLMARDGLTFDDVVIASELDERTLRSVALGRSNPHARTLHKLAEGLGVTIDELFLPSNILSVRQFDRATNSVVEEVVAANAAVFEGWTNVDFDELYSRFGTGGQLTETGVLAAAPAMHDKREVLRKTSDVLESSHHELLTEFVVMLYHRATTLPSTGEASSS